MFEQESHKIMQKVNESNLNFIGNVERLLRRKGLECFTDIRELALEIGVMHAESQTKIYGETIEDALIIILKKNGYIPS